MLKKRSEGKKMRNLLILGAGGHGHVVAETARAMQDSEGNPIYDKIDLLDDLKEHGEILEEGVHLDCGAIIKGSRIPEGEKIPCGMVIENQNMDRKEKAKN